MFTPLRMLSRRTAATAFAAAMLVGGLAGVASAAGGSSYSPAPPVPKGTPGGYTHVVAVYTIPKDSPNPTTIHLVIGKMALTITVPAGIFHQTAELVITRPVLNQLNADLSHIKLGNYVALGGLAVSVVRANGKLWPWRLRQEIVVIIRQPAFGLQDQLLEFTSEGRHFLDHGPLHLIKKGEVMIDVVADPAYAVLAPRKG